MMILEHYPQVNHQLRRLVERVRAELAAQAAAAADLVAEAGLAPPDAGAPGPTR
jgi:hypothetical protein